MTNRRRIIHIDMDAFYASVEQLDNPELKGKPVIVGAAPEQRGVVAAASYEARKYGIHSAMPTSQAVRLCPDIIILPVRMERYSRISSQIHKIFYDYTPDIEPISLDEAFLDVTGSVSLFGSAERIGKEIKSRIKAQLGLISSVGIADNKFLAKLASDLDKPDGFVVITEENKQNILDPLDISTIWGIGKVTDKELRRNGIKTVKQLRESPLKVLKCILGNRAEEIQNLARGIDNRQVTPSRAAKSISEEQTFADDIIDKDFLLGILREQVETVAQRLRVKKLECKTVVLKFRYSDFRTITRNSTLDMQTNTTKVLLDAGEQVFEKWYKKSRGKLRLLGFGVSNLRKEGSGQKQLFSDKTIEKQKRIDQVYDKIRDKFGSDSLKRGK
jgi:DNA polymerase-4